MFKQHGAFIHQKSWDLDRAASESCSSGLFARFFGTVQVPWRGNLWMELKSNRKHGSNMGHLSCSSLNYTGIDPKQQQTMFPRRSCAIKNSLGAPFLRKKTKKKGDKPRNPSWNKKEGGNHDGTQCHNTRETSPTTLPGTRWSQDMMMEQNARIPGTKKSWWNKIVS